jgi:hypothetical protein
MRSRGGPLGTVGVCVCDSRAAQSVAGRGSLGESYATGARAAAAGGCRPDV